LANAKAGWAAFKTTHVYRADATFRDFFQGHENIGLQIVAATGGLFLHLFARTDVRSGTGSGMLLPLAFGEKLFEKITECPGAGARVARVSWFAFAELPPGFFG
jgi:hypothetical protein